MKNQGINIDEIRNLNKLKVYSVKNGGESTPIFEAYMVSPIGTLKASINKPTSFSKQLSEMAENIPLVGGLMKSKIASAVAGIGQQAFGNWSNVLGQGFEAANELNWNFNYKYAGATNEFSHTFKCELITKEDVFLDVLFPLWRLLRYVLPDEGDRLDQTELWKAAGETADRAKKEFMKAADTYLSSSNNSFTDALKAINNFLDENGWKEKATKYFKAILGEITDSLGSISQIQKPEQLQGGMSHTRLQIGDYITIDNVIITDVSFDVPYLYFENGLFDRVTVNISVSGNRKLTLKQYDWLKDIVVRRERGYSLSESEKLSPKKASTLNNTFNPGLVAQRRGVDTVYSDTSNLA